MKEMKLQILGQRWLMSGIWKMIEIKEFLKGFIATALGFVLGIMVEKLIT